MNVENSRHVLLSKGIYAHEDTKNDLLSQSVCGQICMCIVHEMLCAFWRNRRILTDLFLNDLFSVLHLMRDVYNSIKY